MSRVIKGSWLDEYMLYTKNQESPDIFHRWCGLSVVGAALERHVVADMGEVGKRGAYQVRPNLFIILVADPALCKKSAAMKLARGLLLRMKNPINIFAQKITTEALLSRMANTMEMEGKKVVHNAACMVFASELSVFLGSDAYKKGLVGVLIELFDCEELFTYETKHEGTQVLRNAWIHLLGATTPTWLRSGFPPESAGGGFTSRIVFVFSDSPRKRRAFTSIDYKVRDGLVRDLNIINKLRGEYKWSAEGRKWYEDWYENMDIKKESRVLLGYNLRKAVNLIKVAEILTVCESDSLMLEERHLVQSLGVLNEVEVDMEVAVKAIEKTTKGSDLEVVYSFIKEEGEISRTMLMRKVAYKHSAHDLDEIIDTLVGGRMVDVREIDAEGSGQRGIKTKVMYSVPLGK